MGVVVVGENLTKMGIHAGQIAKSIGSYMDGGGGGRPHLATAGGKDNDKLEMAIEKTSSMIIEKLNNIKATNAV